MDYIALFKSLLWATVVGVPLFVSIYILRTPNDKIVFSWQNFRMSRTRRVLKDRHFKRAPNIVRLCKVLSVFVMIACVWALLWLLGVNFWSLLNDF